MAKLLKIFALLTVVIFIHTVAHAMPVFPRDEVLRQADGTTFDSRLYGDEWHNGYETKDGYTIIFDEQVRSWVYAELGLDDSLVSSGLIVNQASPTEIKKHLRPKNIKRGRPFPNSSANSTLYSATDSQFSAVPASGPPVPTAGNHNTLVILVNFTDRVLSTTEAQWADLVFNPSEFSRVRHYYREVSYNKLDIVPVVESYGTANNGVVVVSLNYPHPDTTFSEPNRILTRDALIAADPYVDFAALDMNGNGYLSTNELHVIIIPAGFEKSHNITDSPGVWAHYFWLYEKYTTPLAPVLDEKIVASYEGKGGYVQLGEFHSDHMATIGIIAHELGHSLWLPDEYDIDGSSYGIGMWGLMGYGGWLTDMRWLTDPSLPKGGSSPSHLTAWDKSYMGWLTPIRISATQTVSIPDITTNPTVYQILDNPGDVDWSLMHSSGTGEYFLLENRGHTSYNANYVGCGVLIWHIWEGASQYNNANTNEAGLRLIDLRQADGFF